VKLLLEHNADISIKNIDKMTPIRCAEHEGRSDIVKFITEWSAVKPKRDRKTRELFTNKKTEKVIVKKRKFKEDEDEEFKPVKGAEEKNKSDAKSKSKSRSASKTKAKKINDKKNK